MYNQKNMKGYTNALIIVFLIIIFMSTAMFLMILGKTADTSSQSEYMTMYAHSLLITLMKTSIDEPGSDCEKMSDLLYNYLAWGNSCTCSDSRLCSVWVDEKINAYLLAFKKPNFDYYFSAKVGSNTEEFGAVSLKTAEKQKWAADVSLFKRGLIGQLTAEFIIAPSD